MERDEATESAQTGLSPGILFVSASSDQSDTKGNDGISGCAFPSACPTGSIKAQKHYSAPTMHVFFYPQPVLFLCLIPSSNKLAQIFSLQMQLSFELFSLLITALTTHPSLPPG